MERDELARRIFEVSHLTGSFKLRSGRTATEYFDKYQFESAPILLDAVGEQMALLIPRGTEILAGLELGGIPVVTAVSRHSGLPVAFVRKEAKKYGTARFSEGAEINGRQVLIIEDVVTSGGQVVASAEELRRLGARIDYALCVIDRQEGGAERLEAERITLISCFKREDLSRR